MKNKAVLKGIGVLTLMFGLAFTAFGSGNSEGDSDSPEGDSEYTIDSRTVVIDKYRGFGICSCDTK
jgi:hypothetical protein